ncbi:hypothetical protein CR203_09840 [Salipaludibacillus neizhouensis]|uniref:Sporulation protein n=2 Tax=Salipaludibacillus neizhouensis TaxID=885475 RepID=A0A3A9KDD1_9BACI|nr:hypothetical protein CR203_09840 [Salipaludibacillus neizhouensis]
MILLSVFCLIGVVGCQAEDDPVKAQGYGVAGSGVEIPQHLAKEAERTVLDMEEVDDATSVALDKSVYVALTVNGFDRFFLKDIRKEAKEKLEKSIPNGEFEVSTDSKVEMELTEIEQALENNKLTKKELEQKIKKVKEDLKG